jgi:hypothetical protein
MNSFAGDCIQIQLLVIAYMIYRISRKLVEIIALLKQK